MGYSRKESDTTDQLSTRARTHTHTHSTHRLFIQHTFILIPAECQALSWMPRFKMNETQAPVRVLTLGCNKWTVYKLL